MGTIPFVPVFGIVYCALLVSAALAIWFVRHRRLLFAIGLLFLPLAAIAFRLMLTDPTVDLPPGQTGAQFAFVVATSFLAVWVGVAAGLLFDRLSAPRRIAPRRASAEPRVKNNQGSERIVN